MDKAAPDPLMAIRNRIDAIDERMHRLLIERSGVIAELIQVKGTSRPAAAFRPDREADMMRRLVMRHEGSLPLVTVEHIWREIITTFTAMQAPFGVVAAPAADLLALRDLIRFYFGFSIPVSAAESGEAAVARVTDFASEIAVVPIETKGRWWRGLIGARAPKVFAKLPFIETAFRPADLPAYVIGPTLKEGSRPDVLLVVAPGRPTLEAAVASSGGKIAARAEDDVLLELSMTTTLRELSEESGVPVAELREVGGFAQPIRHMADRVA
jgi:chorismate mutase-like protein